MWLFSVCHLACYFKRLLFCAMYLISFLCTTKIVIYEESTFLLLLFLWVFFFVIVYVTQSGLESGNLAQNLHSCLSLLNAGISGVHLPFSPVVMLFSFWSFERHWESFPVLDLQIVLLGTYCLQVFEWMCVLISPGYIRGVELLGCMVTLYNWPRNIKLLSDMFIS